MYYYILLYIHIVIRLAVQKSKKKSKKFFLKKHIITIKSLTKKNSTIRSAITALL